MSDLQGTPKQTVSPTSELFTFPESAQFIFNGSYMADS